RGKGYALSCAFEHSLREGLADAVTVVDADTTVSANLLRAFAARIARGADAVQADYAVQNPNASWRTRLLRIAFGSFHVLRSLARERFGLSSGLRGNGMCFTADCCAPFLTTPSPWWKISSTALTWAKPDTALSTRPKRTSSEKWFPWPPRLAASGAVGSKGGGSSRCCADQPCCCARCVHETSCCSIWRWTCCVHRSPPW